VDRRAFLGTVAGGLLTAPLTAEAQEAAKAARIGWLAVNLTANPRLREAFVQGLRDLGYVEGRNVVIEDRSAEGKAERWNDSWSAPVASMCTRTRSRPAYAWADGPGGRNTPVRSIATRVTPCAASQSERGFYKP